MVLAGRTKLSVLKKLFSGGHLFVFVKYLCNRSPKIKTKNIKNYSSILAIVNHWNGLVKLLGCAILATAVAGSKQSLHYRSYQCNESVGSCDLSCHCFCIKLMNQNRLIEGKIIITPIMLKRFYILLDF